MVVNVKTYLTNYRKKADRFLDSFFAEEEKRAAKISPLCAEAVLMYRDYMSGGKMARGALTVLGYKSAGGKNERAIIAPSVAVEIIHSFILIHDDWIDNDFIRRGKPTVHLRFEKIHQQRFKKGNRKRWAGGMAFVLGDIGCWLGYKLINESDFPSSRKVEAISSLSENLIQTGYGEFLDITYDLVSGFDWEEILKIRRLKTAYYTLVMPLVVGISLAGGNKTKLRAAEKFGFPVGIAFQLRDDYLGLFGDEKIIGKSASADLKEGKKTLMIAKALEILKGKEKKLVERALGNRNLTGAEVKKARKAIKSSGAVDYCQNLAQELVNKGKKTIPELTTDSNLAEIYSGLADYLITRNK